MAKQVIPLPRGSACLHCRRRKVKCDAQRPVCGPCMRGPDPEQCDYDLGIQGSAKPENVAAVISQLRANIRQIDLRSTASVIMGAVTPVDGHGQVGGFSNDNHTKAPASLPRELQEPPTFIIQVLLHYFFQSISSFPFFLNVRRFEESALLPVPIGSQSRPHAALLSAAYLCSLFIASISEPGLRDLEPNLLHLALQYSEEEYWGSEPHRVIDIIQCELLLAAYFLKSIDILQGRHHLSRALDLCYRARLNLSREHAYLASLESSDPNFIVLPETSDPVQIGERINAFWAVLTVNNTWMPALGVPSLVSLTDPDKKVETPWPLDMGQYERGMLVPSTFNSMSLQSYLRGVPDQVHSYLSYATKAALLYLQVSQFTSSKVDANLRNSAQFQIYMVLIQKLLVLMPTYQDVIDLYHTEQHNEARQRIFAKSIAHAANIVLHAPFAKVDLTSRKACLDSASEVITWIPLLADVPRPACGFSAIQSTSWRIACKALVDEILILKSGAILLTAGSSEENINIDRISELLQKALSAMRRVSLICPMGRYQYIKLQETLVLL